MSRGPAHPDQLLAALHARVQRRDQTSLDSLVRLLPLKEVTVTARVAKALSDAGDLAGSEAVMRTLVATSPRMAGPYYGLARLLHLSGNAAEAAPLLERGLAFEPNHAPSLALLAGVLHYIDVPPRRVFETHVRLGRLIASQARGKAVAPLVDRDPARRLRIAYMSGDFRDHSVSWFAEPLLESHDRDAFEVWAYATGTRPADAVTARLKVLVESRGGTWRECASLSDDDLAQRIRDDRIDIVIELSGLTEGNRLAALARRPAPIIVTAIGYPDTTGLDAIDARLVDHVTDPPGAEAFAVERLLRLDRCFLCYKPPADAPAPSRDRSPDRPITFGSFNALFKCSPTTLDLWAAALRAVPGSGLVLKNQLLDVPFRRERLASQLASRGIDPSRVQLLGKIADRAEHLALYNRIDVALDTAPYNGTTTTCEALWMGVPVVTLRGGAHAARVGASLLGAVGLPELVASDPASYVSIAASLATDPARLDDLRASLRPRVASSPLCDAPAYARAVEAALRSLWTARTSG